MAGNPAFQLESPGSKGKAVYSILFEFGKDFELHAHQNSLNDFSIQHSHTFFGTNVNIQFTIDSKVATV